MEEMVWGLREAWGMRVTSGGFLQKQMRQRCHPEGLIFAPIGTFLCSKTSQWDWNEKRGLAEESLWMEKQNLRMIPFLGRVVVMFDEFL